MIINPGIVEKSISFGSKYGSGVFNDDHKLIYGNSFCVSGFSLISLEENSPGSGLSLTLAPGVFSSSGILVRVKNSVAFSFSVSPKTTQVVVGYTEDNKDDTPVFIELVSPHNVTEKMAIIGHYTPSGSIPESITGKDLRESSFPRYRPAPHLKLEELAGSINSGMETYSIPAIEVYGNKVGSDFRVPVKNIPLTKKDHRLMVFFMGILLEEDSHYEIESPSSLILKGATQYGLIWNGPNQASVTFDNYYTFAFIDIWYTEDILFREIFSFPSDVSSLAEFKTRFPASKSDSIKNGDVEILVFSRGNSSNGGGTLISPDRYSYTNIDDGGDPREGLVIRPRSGWRLTNQHYGWVNDEFTGSQMSSGIITVIGVRGLSGISKDYRYSYDVPDSGGVYLPIVHQHSEHPALTSNYIQTKIPYKANSGELQVFVDGHLCPADHYPSNNLRATASSTPNFGNKISYQIYCNDLNAGAYELGTVPIENSKHGSVLQTPSEAKNMVSVFFRPNFLSSKIKEIKYGASSFGALDEVIDQPGIDEAIFNLTGGRYWDDAIDVKEFYSSSLADFNANYFVTYESLAGITGGQSSASYSILTSLTVSATMFYDVPIGFSDAITYSRYLNFAPTVGMYDTQDPLQSDGSALTDSVTGLYTVISDPDKYFSINNPILTYAGLDAYLQRWMDSFGFYTGSKTAPRSMNRTAGVTYDAEGKIVTSFSSLLTNRTALGLSEDLSLVELMDSLIAKIGGDSVPFAYCYGYAFGGAVINLYSGIIAVVGDDLNYRTHPAGTPFTNGIYWGNIGFESPAKRIGSITSPAILDLISRYPENWDNGIITPIGPNSNSIINGRIGNRTGTINNIVPCVYPVVGNSAETRFEFVWCTAGTANEERWSSTSEIGIRIRSYNMMSGQDRKRTLTKFFVFGPFDPDAPSKFLSGRNDENWYRID